MALELLRERVEAVYNVRKGSHGVKLLVLLVYAAGLLCVCLALRAARVGVAPGLAGLLVLYLVACEAALRSNVTFAPRTTDARGATLAAKHGDLVLFRSYDSYDVPEVLLYRHVNALTSRRFFGHIGLVVVVGGGKYVLESSEDRHWSELTGGVKNGVILQGFAQRVGRFQGRVHLVPTSLGAHMADESTLRAYLRRMRHVGFVTWKGGISCLFLMRDVLSAFGLLRNPRAFPWHPEYFLDPAHYSVPVRFGPPLEVLTSD
jgi:hypothetical protein